MANLKQRIETHRRLPTAQIVNFRLERYDKRGNRLQPIPVEMRGMTITGYIAEGERVQVGGKFHNGTLYAKKVENVTTGGGISTGAMGGFGRRYGRRAEALLAVVVLLALGLSVRFVPQVYNNTPMGLNEYQQEVHGTCERLAKISASRPSLTFDAQNRVDRTLVLNAFDSEVLATRDTYQLLLSHPTPIVRQSRRDRVAALMPALNQFFTDVRRRLLTLPRLATLDQLTQAEAGLQPENADVSARLNDAMSQLAGGTCHVT
ncbi:MAG: hypothetical protein M3042_04760 [Actinomycetota bacterium]|nr:hypothetical protein [Actinomycetota bacterium]